MLFEEIKPNMLERIEDLDRPLEHVLEELMDGDIIVFQKELNGDEDYRLPTSRDYFRDLFYKVRNLKLIIPYQEPLEYPLELDLNGV